MNEYSQGMKLLLSYNMRSESGQEYYQFILGNYIPSMQTMGLQMSEAWSTQYGNGPDRLIGFVASDEQTMQDLLGNEKWHSLNNQLLHYVTDFSYKVIPYREGFQI